MALAASILGAMIGGAAVVAEDSTGNADAATPSALDGATFPGGVFPDKSDAKRDAMNEKITYLESTVKKLRNDLDRLRPYRVRDRDQM